MALQLGTAIVFGAPTVTSLKTSTTQTLAAAATAKAWIVTGMSLSKSGQTLETMDSDGDIVNVTIYGQADELTIDAFPASSSQANAKTANLLPAAGDVMQIVLSGATEDADVAAATAYWSVMSASKTRSNTDKATFSIQLKRWGGISDVSQV